MLADTPGSRSLSLQQPTTQVASRKPSLSKALPRGWLPLAAPTRQAHPGIGQAQAAGYSEPGFVPVSCWPPCQPGAGAGADLIWQLWKRVVGTGRGRGMRHPSLLGNKQPRALSKLGGGCSLSWGGVCIPCLVPLSSHPGPGHLPVTCWNLWLSLGHHRGDSSCTWRVDARCGWGRASGCPTSPCALWGLPPRPCLQPGPSAAQEDCICVGSSGPEVAIPQGDCGRMAGL